jgi:hypothetical protein
VPRGGGDAYNFQAPKSGGKKIGVGLQYGAYYMSVPFTYMSYGWQDM